MKRLLTFTLLLIYTALAWAQPKMGAQGPNGKWGFRDKNGNWAIQAKFDAIDKVYSFSSTRPDYGVVKMGNLWGCVNKNGEFVTQPVLRTSKMAADAGEGTVKKPSDDGMFDGYDVQKRLWGFTNHKGQFIVPPTFDDIDANNNFRSGKSYAIVKQNGYWGVIDNKGYLIVKPYMLNKEDAAKAATEATAFAALGQSIYTAYDPEIKKFGFANYKGNWVIDAKFSAVDMGYTFTGNRPFAVVKTDRGWGCVNAKGTFVVPPTYQKAELARNAAYKIPSINKTTPANELANKDDNKHKKSLKAGATIRVTDGNSYAGGASVKAPTINIISPKDGEGYSQPNVNITYEAKTFDGSNPQVLAYVNGELVSTKGVQRTGKQITLTLPRSSQGVSRIQLIAKDGKGQNSDPASIALRYVGAESKPQLHLMAVGVSDYTQADLKLQNAAKDAQDFVNTIKNLGLQQYDRLASATLITNAEATDRNIKRNLSQLVNKVNQGDVILLFFSGHGAKEGSDTYFLSVNAESNDLFSTAVNFDDIKTATRRLKDKKCRIIVFMDACHSGALYGQKSIAENYALSEPGIIGFYSSTESQKSNESEKWENGIFTKALLEGLKGKAADANGAITLDNLERHIRETVRRETNGTQMPIFENKQGNFVLFNKK
ncbi:MAG: WG repeat-containing protein [Paludibacteraceae bacterium]|nr:WG repeat-containing protein [Paludibacteraceae bacterium]